LILLSIVLGAVLAFFEPVWWALFGWCAAAAIAAGLAVSGLAAGLGTFTGAYFADAGVLALLVFGIAGTSAGLTRHTSLRPVEGLFALTMLLLGIPSAGALVPPELLPQPWRAIGPALPPASALDALRGVTFFGGAAIGTSMAVLAGWAAFGALLLLLPTRPGRTPAKPPIQATNKAPPSLRRDARRPYGDTTSQAATLQNPPWTAIFMPCRRSPAGTGTLEPVLPVTPGFRLPCPARADRRQRIAHRRRTTLSAEGAGCGLQGRVD
jgi:hypothetical protein